MSDWIVNEGTSVKPPVKLGTLIDVEHRDGERFFGVSAGIGPAHEWDFGPRDRVGEACPADIIYWRVHGSE